jgi:hypothetical protein
MEGGGRAWKKQVPWSTNPDSISCLLCGKLKGVRGVRGGGLSTSNNIDPEHYSVGEASVSVICVVGMNARKLLTILQNAKQQEGETYEEIRKSKSVNNRRIPIFKELWKFHDDEHIFILYFHGI